MGGLFDLADVVTFVMVLVVQYRQHKNTEEIKMLIRELVRAVPEADTNVIESAKGNGK